MSLYELGSNSKLSKKHVLVFFQSSLRIAAVATTAANKIYLKKRITFLQDLQSCFFFKALDKSRKIFEAKARHEEYDADDDADADDDDDNTNSLSSSTLAASSRLSRLLKNNIAATFGARRKTNKRNWIRLFSPFCVTGNVQR